MKKNLLLMLLVLLVAFMLPACGDDDDETTTDDDDDTDGDTDDDDDTTDDDDDNVTDYSGEPGSIAGMVIVFGSTDNTPAEGVVVRCIDNLTGEPLADVDPITTGAEGTFSFTDIPTREDNLIAILVEGVEGASMDSYHFNLQTTATNEVLFKVDNATVTVATAAAGVDLEAGKGVVAGAVYWVNADDAEEPVGCSTVSADPAGGDVRYFGDTYPAKPENQAVVNPLNPRFIIANLPADATGTSTTLNASVDGTVVGSTKVVAFPDSICIGNIYATTATNPGLETCE